MWLWPTRAATGCSSTPLVTTTIGQAHIFLPALFKPLPGISGLVTFQGAPLGNQPLELRFFDGSTWSTRASLATETDGTFLFTSVPALAPGQKYYVRFTNTANPKSLFRWGTQEITAFADEQRVDVGTFDVANIELSSPAAGATVALPASFQWIARTATPSDNYEFDLAEPNTGNPFFYTDPPLGYVSSYNLAHLPPGFKTNTPYIWYMWVYDTNGGYDLSYWAYYVRFSNTGSAQPSAQSPGWLCTAALAAQLADPR